MNQQIIDHQRKNLAGALAKTPEGIDAPDAAGSSPLLIAITLGVPETALVLLEMGADPLLGNHNGVTPLDAARSKLSDWQDLVTAMGEKV